MKLFTLINKTVQLINERGWYFTWLKIQFFVTNKFQLWWLNMLSLDGLYRNWAKSLRHNGQQSKNSVPKISVIIPNYNYAKYLPQRIQTIVGQTLTPFEIIFLDDASTDDSVLVATQLLQNSGIDYRIIVNDHNQGVYSQWVKGLKLARGDYIWIAEADDFCRANLLEVLAAQITTHQAELAYCQSIIIDGNNKITHPNTLPHTHDFSFTQWRKDFCQLGTLMVENYWFHKNLILNASSCIFARQSVNIVNLEELSQFKYCGDWYFYVSLLRSGKVCYTRQVLNVYRKHMSGVTQTNMHLQAYSDEINKIKQFMRRHYSIAH